MQYIYSPNRIRFVVKMTTYGGVTHWFDTEDKWTKRFVLNNGRFEWCDYNWRDKVPKELIEKLIKHKFITSEDNYIYKFDDEIVEMIKNNTDSYNVFDFDEYVKSKKINKKNDNFNEVI